MGRYVGVEVFVLVDLDRQHIVTPWAFFSQYNGQFFFFGEFNEIYVKMSDTNPRFGGGRGQEFATAYSVQYWRAGTWHTYKNITGHSVRTENETA